MLPSAQVEDFTYGYVGVTTPHYQHRPSCLAPQLTGTYAPCPVKGWGAPGASTNPHVETANIFLYTPHVSLSSVYASSFSSGTYAGDRFPRPFLIPEEYSSENMVSGHSPRVRKCASQEHLTPRSYSLFACMRSPEFKLRLNLAHLNFFGRFRILWTFCNWLF